MEMMNMKERFSEWDIVMRERRELEGTRGRPAGISARGGDAQQMCRDAGSQQAGQHNTDELQQRQPQGSGGNIKHVGADEGGHPAEAAVGVQAARVGRAAPAAAAGPAAAEGHRAVLLPPPGRGEPVAVALHTAAGQGALQRVQGVRHPVVLPVCQQRLAQPLLEALRQALAVQERREPGRQPGRQHDGQEGAVGAQESPVLRSGAEASQEAPDDDSDAGGQEDGGGAGAVAGRERQVSAQRHLGPEADDEHGQPRCPEDEAEGHEGQLEQGHGALGPGVVGRAVAVTARAGRSTGASVVFEVRAGPAGSPSSRRCRPSTAPHATRSESRRFSAPAPF